MLVPRLRAGGYLSTAIPMLLALCASESDDVVHIMSMTTMEAAQGCQSDTVCLHRNI